MKTQKNAKYCCEKCQFVSDNKYDYRRHLLTSKHKKTTITTEITTNKSQYICACYKKYNDRAGLWRHKKSCNYHDNTIEDNTNNQENDMYTSTCKPLEHSHSLLGSQQVLINEIKELKTIVEELKSNGITNNQTINHNNNNNNNTQNNNQFNLQMYLDETCSNAMNIDTFLKNINVTIENVIEIGEIGYSKGIGNLIAKHINAMKQTDKPIQTTDVKRGLSWIKNKDNEWVKDEDLALGNNLILFVGDKYFRKYNVGYKTIEEWRDGQSRIHAKIIKSLHQIATTVSTDDRSGYYSKIHKIIAENTVIKK